MALSHWTIVFKILNSMLIQIYYRQLYSTKINVPSVLNLNGNPLYTQFKLSSTFSELFPFFCLWLESTRSEFKNPQSIRVKKKSRINYQQPKIYLFFYLANSYQLSRCVKQATWYAYKEGDSKKWKILLILKIVWYKICFQRINFLYLRDTINELRAGTSRPKFLLAQFFRLGYSVKLIPYTHQLLIQLFFSWKFSTLVHRTERKRRSKKKKLGKPLLWHTEVLTAKDLLVYCSRLS